jgi:hypothetical protein
VPSATDHIAGVLQEALLIPTLDRVRLEHKFAAWAWQASVHHLRELYAVAVDVSTRRHVSRALTAWRARAALMASQRSLAAFVRRQRHAADLRHAFGCYAHWQAALREKRKVAAALAQLRRWRQRRVLTWWSVLLAHRKVRELDIDQ